MVLSIIVISHNQKEQLRRCVDSVLSQSLPFEHEIILSDDASTDGTWELAQEYEGRYPQVKACQCDTNDYDSSNTDERSGWNRCNGYKYATGKYIAHIDGDDFIMPGSDIYRKQVELLEHHPECSCCMANDYTLKEDEDVSFAKLLHKDVFETGQILSSGEFLKNNFRESHCFVYRRNPQADPVTLYGGFYEDALLTAHYIQYGNIVCLKDAGYVYVHYSSSIMGNFRNNNDVYVICCPALYVPYIIPVFRDPYMSGRMHIKGLWKVVRLLLFNHRMQEANLSWIRKLKSKSYLYWVFERRLTMKDYVRLTFLYGYLALLLVWMPSWKFPYKILWRLLL